mmetsp:Transcript_63276/g.184924  ORF Transcript_63276/g.184924 Transcript_63276/m.184924 type:complete len:1075 (-) Transcript_63276:133-3357(-)
MQALGVMEPTPVEKAERPVQLFGCSEDPQLYRLQVKCASQVGIVFRLCEALLRQTFDIVSAEMKCKAGQLDGQFWLRRPSSASCSAADREALGKCWGRELEELILRCTTAEPPRPEDPRTLERLAVNPDLLCVSTFRELTGSAEAPRGEFRYELEVTAINQSGVFAYLALVFFRSRLNIVECRVSTPDTGAALAFVLSTTFFSAQQVLRSYLDLPACYSRTQSGSGENWETQPRGGGVPVDELPRIFSQLHASCRESLSEESDKSPCSPQGPPKQRSIDFPNGDRYEGQWMEFPDRGKQHGYGTYDYRCQNHDTYLQYRGQWKEGRKHGHGVLFYQHGGVYVGQWENNHKHGLGVLLKYVEEEEAPQSMPSYCYEGSWVEDRMHGFGVEETPGSFFFGSFYEGGRSGKGVQVTLGENSRVTGCEALDDGRWWPLLDALEAKAAGFHTGSTELSLASASSPHIDGSSQAFSSASTTASGGGTSAAEAPASPGPRSPGAAPAALWRGASPRTRKISASWMMSPQQNLHIPCSTTLSSPGGSAPVSPIGNRDDFEFVLIEEEADPLQSTLQGSAPVPLAKTESTKLAEHSPRQAPSRWPSKQRARPSPPSNAAWCAAPSPGSAPSKATPTPSPGGTLSRTVSSGSASYVKVSAERRASVPSAERRSLTPERVRTNRGKRPILCPMLWSEDELAAFLGCLGLGSGVVSNVLRQKVKGVDQFLQMSDLQMEDKFGLESPLERQVVRKALRRFLELDRLQNPVQGHKLADAMDDAILRDFMIPLNELQVEREISQGGFGMVYRGLLRPCEQRGKLEAGKVYKVAIKDMKGDRSVRIFELLKECRVMASLNHPNLCNFLGICAKLHVHGSKQYILSELMDCSLFDLIHRPQATKWLGELDTLCALDLAEGICVGIAYMHSLNLVHADLKSSNILIDHTSSRKLIPKICDFGHAAVRSHPASHHRCGTPHWAAPEALRNEAIGPKSDVFSFGVMLWELLAQSLPHQSLTFAQVVGAVGWSGVLPEMELLPEVPPSLRELLLRCLGFAPADRPLAQELRPRLRRVRRQARTEAFNMLTGFLMG